MKITLLFFLAFFGLCGCGQKGPLYLPQADQVPEQAPVSQPVPEAPSTPQ